MKTKNISRIFNTKLMESEFENQPLTSDGVVAPYQPLVDELAEVNKKMRAYDLQGDRLVEKLRKLQKNYYDDMKIIDENYKGYDGEIFPWRSGAEHMRGKYAFWDVQTTHLNLSGPILEQVAIRKHGAGNEKQIKVIDGICQRLMALDEMYHKLYLRRRQIQTELGKQSIAYTD